MNSTNLLGGGNLCLTKAALAAGTTTTLTTAAISIVLGGRYYAIAGATNGAAGTTDAVTGAAFRAIPVLGAGIFVVGYDAAGTRRVIQGTVIPAGGYTAGDEMNALEFPNVPDEICAIGYIVVQVGSTGAAWTWGTSNFSGPPTGVTFTFVDCAYLPAKPVTL
jgi:hypothetical protein